MNVEDFFNAQSKIIILLRQKSDEFDNIKNSKESLVTRWQQFIGIILPIQLQVIQEYEYSGDQSGLSLFNEQLMRLSVTNLTLRQQNADKWRFLLEHAFGLTEYKEISLQEAQKLIKDIANAMTSNEFLEEVDQFFEDLNNSISMSGKRQELLKVLFPLHMSIMSEHGFDGETGYILAQRALMDYYFDPFIKEKASYAQKIVFERAKLLENEVSKKRSPD